MPRRIRGGGPKGGWISGRNAVGTVVMSRWKGKDVIRARIAPSNPRVEGVHEPLVDAVTFVRVQEKRFGKKGVTAGQRRKIVPELPLRGHLLDPDSLAVLTGSGSRSRHGYRVWYYHGQGKGAYRLRADVAHEAFEAMLAEVRLAPRVADLLRAMAAERVAGEESERKRRRRDAQGRLEQAEQRLLAVDARFLDGDLDRESHARLLAHYRAERDAARVALA